MQARVTEPDESCPRCQAELPELVAFCGLCGACHDREVLTHLRATGVLREHEDARLGDFKPAHAEAGRKLLEAPEIARGLVITGSCGPGKTRFLAALAREALNAHRRVVYGMARELLRRTWNLETQDEVIRLYATTPLLLIDDLGHEGSQTPGVIGTLHELISKRHGNYLPTAITLNITLDDVARVYDRAIEDRMASWLPIVMNGPSRRRR